MYVSIIYFHLNTKMYSSVMTNAVFVQQAYVLQALTTHNFLCCVRVFEACWKVVPLTAYVEGCKSDVCTTTTSGCASLQAYASACAKAGVCIDWRNATNGECGKVICFYKMLF